MSAELEHLLPLAWAAIIAFGVVMYVLMDGFDLGVGILFPLAPSHADRDTMMNSVAPVWDGNETWLVLGGAGLLGAFPLAYSILLPALYLPIILMLLGLIFRGVAFEFRFKAGAGRHWWDKAFNLGSLVAAFFQGVVLGSFVHGIPVAGRAYAGGAFDWLTPFALLCGAALVCGYGLLGATWLILKTEGPLQRWARAMALPLLLLVLAGMAGVSLWTPLINQDIADRWFTWPNLLYLSPVPVLTAAVALALLATVRRARREWLPFLLTMALFLLGYLGLAISLFPRIVPPSVDIWMAAAAPSSQLFLLYGTAAIIPVILAYTAWSYYVFRGKVGEGYH